MGRKRKYFVGGLVTYEERTARESPELQSDNGAANNYPRAV
ncbi:MAG TPA: hypothetical protein VGL70_20900 [Candidatus Binatia bacterium]